MVALQARREQGTHPDLQAAASPDRRDAWAVEVSKGAHRVPNGSRPPSVTPHAALSRPERDRQPATATWGDSSRALLGAAAASYAPGGQPARHACHRDPARPARSASTPRGPPRYSAGCRGYPASPAAGGGGPVATRPIAHRASARAEVDRSCVVCFFLRAAWLEQEARSRAWLCPPRRHKRASAPLRRLAATRSARSLPCEWLPHARQPAAVLSPRRPLGQLPFRGALEASWQGLGAPGLGWF